MQLGRNGDPKKEHLDKFYQKFDKAKEKWFDGLIITWANVETKPFEEVSYRPELQKILDYARDNITSTIWICRWAQAWLYHYYWIPKILLNEKAFGVKKYNVLQNSSLLHGLDDNINAPVSRRTTNSIPEVNKYMDIVLWDKNGLSRAIASDTNNKFVAISPHFEYNRWMLAKERLRDVIMWKKINLPSNYFPDEKYLEKNFMTLSTQEKLQLILALPKDLREKIFSINYIKDNNIKKQFEELTQKNIINSIDVQMINALTPEMTRSASAHMIYTNRLYFVYQNTPFDLMKK